ncbi:hypothetical protein DdX_18492 [Ditylenchus destructor]|uniref:Uncharacterized protein n=1 Tax=Ditylenchus destructor TaxID=166010 RepID=A0AAD4ML51_9BILA|nr:hypothetical protein DdX_18492 [Ditylenchus destructor]
MDQVQDQAHTKEVFAHTEEISVPIAEVGKEIQELEPVLTGPSTNLEDPNPRPKRGANGKRTGTRLRSFTKGLMKKDFKNVPSFLLATFKLNWTCYRAFILRAFKRKRFDETKLKKEVSGFCRWLVRWGQNGSTKLRTFGGFVATIFMSAISIVGLPAWIVLDIIILWLYCLATVV